MAIINIHGGHNPKGKIACGAVGLLDESEQDRIIKNKVMAILKAKGHTVYDCTVDNGISQSDVLKKIVAKCNAHTVDLDISIHFNASNGSGNGTEVWVYSNTSKSLTAAKNVVNAITALGFKNRGVKYSKSLYVLKNTKSPAMLIECCFVDSQTDYDKYDADKMATAIANAIIKSL